MRGLTQRQQEGLDVIREHIARKGFPPTIRELGAALGITSTNGVSDMLKALEAKGAIRRDKAKGRALLVVDGPSGNQTITRMRTACLAALALLKRGETTLAQVALEAALGHAGHVSGDAGHPPASARTAP